MDNYEKCRKTDNDILRFVEDFDSITIKQCADLIYPDAQSGYKIAQRKLSKLVGKNRLLCSNNEKNHVNVYFLDKENKLSWHDLYVNSLVIALINCGAKDISVIRPKYWLDGKIRSDAMLFYSYNKDGFVDIVEVSWTHKKIPIENYNKLYESREAHNLFGGFFPRIVVIDDGHHRDNFYYSPYFTVTQIKYNMNDITKLFIK